MFAVAMPSKKPKSKRATVPLSVHIPTELDAAIDAEVTRRGRAQPGAVVNRSDVVREALAERFLPTRAAEP